MQFIKNLYDSTVRNLGLIRRYGGLVMLVLLALAWITVLTAPFRDMWMFALVVGLMMVVLTASIISYVNRSFINDVKRRIETGG